MPGLPHLSDAQRELMHRWLPGADLVRDMSWDLIDTTVLHVRCGGRDLVVKATGPGSVHMLSRELTAHQQWLTPLRRASAAPRLLHHSTDAAVIVTTFLPGILVQGTPAEDDPATYRRAGRLLRLLHGQDSRVDPDYPAQERARTRRWITADHQIPLAQVREIGRRLEVADREAGSPTLVPTHGDYTPRNWLIGEDERAEVRIIDFGRAAWRAPMTDFARLQTRQFVGRPDLEEAFVTGYGADPRADRLAWHALLLREAVGVAAWARQVGDTGYEQEGLRTLQKLLDEPRHD